MIAKEWSIKIYNGQPAEPAPKPEPPKVLVPKHSTLNAEGWPTLETVKRNGKINLIDLEEIKEPVTERPRKHLTSYLLYVKDTRADLKNENPNMSFKALSQLMADRWKALDPKIKMEYEILSAEDRRRHDELVIKYETWLKSNGFEVSDMPGAGKKKYKNQQEAINHQVRMEV